MGSGVIVKPLKSVCLQSESDWRQSRRFPPLGRLCFAFDPVNQIKRNTLQSSADFDRIARHFLALRLVFARFDPRQIGPRLPAPAGATAAPARQARPESALIGLRRAPCLPPCGVKQSGRAFPHRGTACPTHGPVPASRFGQTRKRPKATVLVPARLWVPLVSSWALPEPKPEFHPKAAALRHRRRPKPHPR